MKANCRAALMLCAASSGALAYVLLRLVLAEGLKPSFTLAWRVLAFGLVGAALVFATFNALKGANTRFTGNTQRVIAVVYAALVLAGSTSWILTAAALYSGLVAVPSETLGRRFAYKGAFFALASTPILALTALFSHTPHHWELALLPNAFLALFGLMIFADLRKLRRHGNSDWRIKVGDQAPPVRLNLLGEQGAFDLDGERGRWVLLCFLRGHWCPVCHVMMRLYRREAPLLAKHGVKLVAVTPSGGPEAQDFANQVGIDYTVLVDLESRVAAQFGAQHTTVAQAPLPAAFLIDPNGVLRYASKPRDVDSFLDVSQVIRVLTEVAEPQAS